MQISPGALEEPINVLSWVGIMYLLSTLTFAATDFCVEHEAISFFYKHACNTGIQQREQNPGKVFRILRRTSIFFEICAEQKQHILSAPKRIALMASSDSDLCLIFAEFHILYRQNINKHFQIAYLVTNVEKSTIPLDLN